MSPEVQLTREMVDGVRRAIREESGIRFWPGELDNAVLETLTAQFSLPWTSTSRFRHPDFKDSRVKRLAEQIRSFPDQPVGQRKVVRISGTEEGQFTEIPYSSSIPDMETLAAVAVESAQTGTLQFIFAGVADSEEGKSVVFASFDNFRFVRASLGKDGPELGREWHIARISLTETGKLQWVTLEDEEWGGDVNERTENVRALLSRINPALFYSGFEGQIPVSGPTDDTLYWFNTSTTELRQKPRLSDHRSIPVGSVPPLYK